MLKGMGHEKNIFERHIELNQIKYFLYMRYGFLCCLVKEKNEYKVPPCFYEITY
jgi:hypothetical protein